jgi:hypothetical protein
MNDKLYVYTLWNTAQVFFDHVPVIVKREGFRLEDVLADGEYPVSIEDDKTNAIFDKYSLTYVNNKANPEILDFIRHFVWGDSLDGTKVKSLDNGEYEIDVSQDQNIQALFKDVDFQNINTPQTSQQNSDQSGMLGSSQSSDQQHIIE